MEEGSETETSLHANCICIEKTSYFIVEQVRSSFKDQKNSIDYFKMTTFEFARMTFNSIQDPPLCLSKKMTYICTNDR